MSRTTNRGVFNASLLPEAQPRWDLFSAGFGLQLVAVTALVVIPLLMPEKLTMVQHYWTTPVEAPPIVAWKPQPPPPQPKAAVLKEVVKPVAKVEPVVAPPVEIPKPKVYNPVVAKALTPVTRKPTTAPEAAEVAKAFPDPNPPMSMGSSALPTLKKPREAVQTGGFGDVDGVKDNGKTNKNPNINVGGSYDMPNGPGVGNGTGGAKGAKGVTGSAGFGNSVAVGGPGGGPQRQVQTGGFDEKAADATNKAAKGPTPPPMTHVQVTSVVKPTYSDEGRAKKIEGDVTLQVTFTATGQIQVLRVVHGLGSGLDEAAEAAARQIKYKPAMQGGQPVDETTNIRITFALAN